LWLGVLVASDMGVPEGGADAMAGFLLLTNHTPAARYLLAKFSH
jgi:hypothetical protein